MQRGLTHFALRCIHCTALLCCTLSTAIACAQHDAANSKDENEPLPFATADPATVPQLVSDNVYSERTIRRIAFGSCNKPDKDQGFWDVIRGTQLDLMLLLGDNHYAESVEPENLKKAYDRLAAIPSYMALRRYCPTLATWDNHDYGGGYPGKLHPHGDTSEQLFLDHFGVSKEDPRRGRTGVYGAWMFGTAPQRVQVILLDLERNRDPYPESPQKHQFPTPHADHKMSLMGDEQWTWFTKQLQQEAEVRIIGSGIQVLSNEHTWRRWGMFPHEREQLLQIIGEATGTTVLLTGDRHRGEISVLNPSGERPLFDITASSFNHCYPSEEKNRLRVGKLIDSPHFGRIEIDWKRRTLTMQLLASEDAAVLLSHSAKIQK